MSEHYVKRILNARIYDLAEETPVDEARQLSSRLNNRVLLKREDLQPVFSFKLRGAYNKMLQLTPEQLQRGVVAASAGNHAQGLALAAKKMAVSATIVMPKTTPQIKVDAVRAHGANVVLHGDVYDEASAHAKQLVVEKSMTYVHPFDDPDVIAGQGTVAMEILRQVSEPIHAVFIPVGGGGLCAGMAAYIKYVCPDVKVIAVEPDDAACLDAALKAGERVTLKQVGIFADGTAVAQIGEETFRVLKDTVDEVVTVSADEISAAIKDTYDDTRAICEPSGALGVAGLKKYVSMHGVTEQTLVAINSGANMNFDRLRYISERTEIGERREAILAVTIPEKPGSFKQFCTALSKRNITEFNYRLGGADEAHIYVGIQVASDQDRLQLVDALRAEGYPLEDMTGNEMAKLHIRHMVGGRAQAVENELVYCFEFPEKPGALMNFLNQLGGRWNISMFHYRNHGAAYGRVLVGMQVPTVDASKVSSFLDELGYVWTNETDNPAYHYFLK